MFFRDIPGKEAEKTLLKKFVLEGRVAHAQLFLGKEGSGHLALALAYVAYINCTDRNAEDSCGVCKSCTLTHKMINPDLHFSFPVVKAENKTREQTTSDDFMPIWRKALTENPYLNIFDWQDLINAGNSKPNINTRECNEIIGKLSFQAFGDGPKILFMWLPEFLGKEGNRLLKLIEEPTENTIIILVAEEQDRILNTILSRCQLIKISPYTKEELSTYLNTKNVGQDSIAQIISLAAGNINKANSLCNGEEKDYSITLFNWLRTSYKGDAAEIQEFVGQLVALNTDQQVQFLEYGLHFFREYIFWLLAKTPKINLRPSEIDIAQKMSGMMDMPKVEKIIGVFNDSIHNINRNVNIRINFTADSVLIGDIMKNKKNTFYHSTVLT